MNLATSGSPGSLGDWSPLFAMLGVYGAVVIGLAIAGGRREGFAPTYLLPRIGGGLERITKLPGWVAASVLQASFGILVAGMGFYNDVAWHVRIGRDKSLFTAPHTSIVVGLFIIFSAAVVGALIANAERVEVGLRIKRWRIPYSMIALGLLGGSALSGFPLDDLWHRFYGIDVTMWSPTHLLMILGASLSPIASWLALAEGNVRPKDGGWARGLHVTVATCALLGLASTQGEFEFGVPQFQQLYHPVLIALAAGIALTAARLVLGRGWPLLIGVIAAFFGTGGVFGEDSHSFARTSALLVFSALAVEIAALLVGTKNRIRYAVACGLAIGTLGLAGEWWWNQGAFQRWTTALLPDGLILGLLAAVSAAIIGTAFATAISGERHGLRPPVIAVGGLVMLFCLAWPLPRHGSDVRAEVSLQERANSTVVVTARVDPPNAADDARWFQAMAWQGGGFEAADMVEREPGVWVSEKPVPVGGSWKTLLRLHRGAEMGAIPIWMPADPEIDASEVPAVDKTATFDLETAHLLREQHGGPGWFAPTILALLGLIAIAWVSSFVLAATKVSDGVELREMARV
jgi:hypothetical protein